MLDNFELGCGKPEARGADSEGVQRVGNRSGSTICFGGTTVKPLSRSGNRLQGDKARRAGTESEPNAESRLGFWAARGRGGGLSPTEAWLRQPEAMEGLS